MVKNHFFLSFKLCVVFQIFLDILLQLLILNIHKIINLPKSPLKIKKICGYKIQLLQIKI